MTSQAPQAPRPAKFKLIWREMRGQRLRYGGAVVALVVGSCFMYLVPLVPQVVLDGVIPETPERASPIVRQLVSALGGHELLRERLWLAALMVVCLTALAGLFTYLRARWAARASEEIARHVRDRLYDQLQHLPCTYHDAAETGDVVQRCTSDVETLRQFLSSQVVEIGRATFMMLIPIPLMLALDPRMTMVSVAVVPPIVVFSYVFFKNVQSRFLKADEAEGRMTAAVQENLIGIRVVRAFARQQFEQDKFAERNASHRGLDFRLYELMAMYWSLSDLLCMGQMALVVSLGGVWLMAGELQVGTLYFFLSAVALFVWPIRMLGRVLTELGKATVAIGRIAEILDSERDSEPVSRVPFRPPLASSGAIVFRDVSFSHGRSSAVVDGVSFRVAPGETLALLGPSGSGKSTLVNLLLRFYDPEAGSIELDGVDIASLGRKQLRLHIAAVMQEPFLYSKTLADNIRLGRWQADDDEIRQAAASACVHDAIVEFENGYDTLVGERGVTLSGGQRQRVALARALVDRPSVLVLDDALSAVDTETERLILKALERRRGRHTTLVIAHRLSTLMNADRILVLDAGRVVQQGTHKTLIDEEGLYRRVWRLQSANDDLAAEDARTASGR